MDLDRLKEDIQKACIQAISTFQQHQSEETHAAAYAKIDGIFHGAMMVLRASGYNINDGEESRVVRRVIEHFQAELLKAFPEDDLG